MTEHRCCRPFAVAVNFEHLRWWPDGAQYVVEVNGQIIFKHVCFCPFCGAKLQPPGAPAAEEAVARGKAESLPAAPTANEPPADVFVRLLLELHQLRLAGKANSPESDNVCAAMEAPWEAMSEPDRERVGDLCEGLYTIEKEFVRLCVPVPQGLACVACGVYDPTAGRPVLGLRTDAGFMLHRPTCGHDSYVTCPACENDNRPYACPRCGWTGEKT